MRNISQEEYLEGLKWAWIEDNIDTSKSSIVPFMLWDDESFEEITIKYHDRAYEIAEEIRGDGCETSLGSLGMSLKMFY